MALLTHNASASRSELNAAVDRIRRRFLGDLCERILTIETLNRAIESGRGEPEDLDALLLHVHRIAGIAASLGFHEVGRVASDVEAQITPASESRCNKSICPDLADTIERLLSELEALLD